MGKRAKRSDGPRQEDSDDPDEEDEESERSCDGSDARLYYELKAEREQRKREKLSERKERERERDYEKEKEEEVRAAYKSLKKAKKEGKTIPVGLIAGQTFALFCSDHVDHLYEKYGTKWVTFYPLDNENNPRLHKQKPGSSKTGMLSGFLCLDADAGCNFGMLQPPKRTRRKAVKIRSDDGKYELSFQFLGNGYLKLSVPRELAFMGSYSKRSAMATAPETFEFVGICHDLEKERAEMKQQHEEEMAETRRSPSPKEN